MIYISIKGVLHNTESLGVGGTKYFVSLDLNSRAGEELVKDGSGNHYTQVK